MTQPRSRRWWNIGSVSYDITERKTRIIWSYGSHGPRPFFVVASIQYRIVRWGFHSVQIIGSQMAVRSVSYAGCVLLPRNIIIVSGNHVCYRLSKPQSLVRPEDLGKLIKFNYLIASRTRDLPACSTAPQSLRYRVPPPPPVASVQTILYYVLVEMCQNPTIYLGDIHLEMSLNHIYIFGL
jgi:hypothetical protein